MTGGSGDLWMVMTVFGVIVLGAVIAWGLRRNRKITPRQDRVAEERTRDVYDAENRDAKENRA
ncbi:hypothetical protein [Hansschlegelia zhihuaiae]|uniref:Uncharacterized protein n=1 Tax=Hansschlegelia zhihuaiae TaxID=405005 RepID=A0A4V1KJG0_9HYPH|nr:hypothetical protein [Hansschlegelia zhihuaiae]RXF74062.1 hypothetical protein EK403_06725 [Hansschlegelia zhihuaiae]